MNMLTTNSKKGIKNFLIVIFLIFTLFAPQPILSQVTAEEAATTTETTETAEPVEAEPPSLSPAEIEKIEAFVIHQMKIAKIPGLSLVIVKNNQTVLQKGFGFANLKSKKPVTPTTLFELASASKPFTALAILQMEQKGLIKLTDYKKPIIVTLFTLYPDNILFDILDNSNLDKEFTSGKLYIGNL